VTILVTGATGLGSGNVGRHVVRELMAADVPVRVLTRSPENAKVPDGVAVVRGDLSKPDTLRDAFDDVDRMYLMAINGDRILDNAADVLEVARRAGVRRVVLLSADGMPLVEVEEPVEESGLEWTHVRPGEFAANTVDYWARPIREHGLVRSAYLDVLGVPVHEADVAAVAATALLKDGHAGAVHVVTGPARISRRQQVAAIAAAIGRDVAVEDLTEEQGRAAMVAEGWPDDIVDHLFSFYAVWVNEPPVVRTTVADVTGRPARTFAQWAADHAADFR
jgi:uncharacterized protein YbjT (DUF2867 family)